MFSAVARRASELLGTGAAFFAAAFAIVLWGISGPFFAFSDTWQLLINTLTTIVTFLMVFIIQNTQNRDSKAMQLKLDEIIKALGRARNRLIDLEHCSDEEIEDLQRQFEKLKGNVSDGVATGPTHIRLPSSAIAADDR